MIINDCSLPLPILKAMENNKYNPGNTDYSPSSITLGAKEYWGKRLYGKACNTRASSIWASFTGTLMHLGLEELLKDEVNVLREIHIEHNWNEKAQGEKLETDRIVGGTVDLLWKLDNGKHILFDYKTMSTASIISDDKIKEWTFKANFYRWLLENAGYKIESLIYIPIFKDWTATKAMRSRSVEDIPCPSITLEKWDRAKIEQEIYDRIIEIEQYRGKDFKDIPYCNPEQRWEKPPVFKVCKEENGKVGNALPNCTFETMEEAESIRDERIASLKPKDTHTYIVKKAGGDPVKCNNWCSLSENGFCDYVKTKETE
jgi:hypothetical protein